MKKYFLALCLMLSLASCTLSCPTINIIGTGTDVVDDTQSVDADVSPDITVPLNAV